MSENQPPRPDEGGNGGAPDPFSRPGLEPRADWSAYPSSPAPDYGDPQAMPPYGVNPYGSPQQPSYGGYAPYGYGQVPHPRGTTALVLGIVGVVVCPFVGIAAFVIGRGVRREIDAEPWRYNNRGQATAGWVLGIISIVYSALVLVYLVVIIGLGVSGYLG
jgi:hypothetical protein